MSASPPRFATLASVSPSGWGTKSKFSLTTPSTWIDQLGRRPDIQCQRRLVFAPRRSPFSAALPTHGLPILPQLPSCSLLSRTACVNVLAAPRIDSVAETFNTNGRTNTSLGNVQPDRPKPKRLPYILGHLPSGSYISQRLCWARTPQGNGQARAVCGFLPVICIPSPVSSWPTYPVVTLVDSCRRRHDETSSCFAIL